ncbi:MAG: diaminopimelate epimerase [Flavobacteriales bacterium]|nr:diaminopimelate epimerase [Flavobacteriales bacterium]
MARLAFSKWQGTGNDFVVVDDRELAFSTADLDLVRKLCDRHVGIGSDGLILLQPQRTMDTSYHMEFFNPDGSQSFCGNGSRCAFAFWSKLTGAGEAASFTAIDGEHTAQWTNGLVRISMRDVKSIERIDDNTDHAHTGSPHLLCWVDDPEALDIITEAHKHRYSQRFAKEGVNVNFLHWKEGGLEMRTYERGVEGETLSCGTGVTAAALSAMSRGFITASCNVHTRGGELRVEARSTGQGGFEGVTLAGPVKEVFTGLIDL